MSKKIWIRILTALSGVVLAVLALLLLAETFFRLPVTAAASALLNARTPGAVLLVLLLALALGTMGVCCVLSLIPPRRNKTRGFVMQKGENGAIGVSVRSIEGLVQTCVNQYNVVSSAEVSVLEKRDGIVILLNIEETAGVNIPLSVGALQKQIRQYVNACTGVDVQEVRVMVENTDNGVTETPYAVQGPAMLTTAATAAELHLEEAAPAEEIPTLEMPVEEIPAPVSIEDEAPALEEVIAPAFEETYEEVQQEEVPVLPVEEPVAVPPAAPVVMPVMPDLPDEEDERPLHQRIFGAEEQPAFVPAPPELVITPSVDEVVEEASELAVEAVEEAAEEIAEDADALGEDAVTEVARVLAMAEAEDAAADMDEGDATAETEEVPAECDAEIPVETEEKEQL